MKTSLKAKILSVLMTLMVALSATGVSSNVAIVANETGAAGILGGLLTAVILVLVASSLMPTISWNAAQASNNLTAQGQTGAASIVDQWTLGVAIVVFVGIFAPIFFL